MKYFSGTLILFVICCLEGKTQNVSTDTIHKRVTTVQMIAPIHESGYRNDLALGYELGIFYKQNLMTCIDWTFSRSYRVFICTVNKMASTHSGIQSIDNEVPSIRGAGPEGTAYYIDGVRILEMP